MASGPDGRDAVERAAGMLGPLAGRDVPLGPLTTYKAGGPASLLVEASTEADLEKVARAVAETGLPALVVGRGSNLLVSDRGFEGIAVVLGPAFDVVAVDGDHVRAGGAASLPRVARQSAAAGLTGLEWGVGIPGSVGGAVRMNAGGHGSDMAGVLERCRVLDLGSGEARALTVAELDYGYRQSAIGPAQVVLEAVLRAAPGDRAGAEATIDEIVRWRREHQPGGRNAGSVFTNPPGDAAGRLIEAAGLKGRRHGTAAVSDKHGNFIQSVDGGSADDVLALITEVADEVERRLGVRLATEIRLVGFPGTYPHLVDEESSP